MKRHRSGFTLIELLVVIAIIAILAAILALPAVAFGAKARAENTPRLRPGAGKGAPGLLPLQL